jgi:hypothetical protein
MKCVQMTIIIQVLRTHIVKIRYNKVMEKENWIKQCCK